MEKLDMIRKKLPVGAALKASLQDMVGPQMTSKRITLDASFR